MGDEVAIRSLWARRNWYVVGFREVFNHFSVSVTNKDDPHEIVQVLTSLESFRFGPTTPDEERGPAKAAYDTVIESIKRNPQVSPSLILDNLRKENDLVAAALNSELKPKELLNH